MSERVLSEWEKVWRANELKCEEWMSKRVKEQMSERVKREWAREWKSEFPTLKFCKQLWIILLLLMNLKSSFIFVLFLQTQILILYFAFSSPRSFWVNRKISCTVQKKGQSRRHDGEGHCGGGRSQPGSGQAGSAHAPGCRAQHERGEGDAGHRLGQGVRPTRANTRYIKEFYTV